MSCNSTSNVSKIMWWHIGTDNPLQQIILWVVCFHNATLMEQAQIGLCCFWFVGYFPYSRRWCVVVALFGRFAKWYTYPSTTYLQQSCTCQVLLQLSLRYFEYFHTVLLYTCTHLYLSEANAMSFYSSAFIFLSLHTEPMISYRIWCIPIDTEYFHCLLFLPLWFEYSFHYCHCMPFFFKGSL